MLKENEICGKSDNIISNQDAEFIYNLTCVECVKESIEKELGISYEEFVQFDYDEQYKLIQSHRKNTKTKSEEDVLIMVGSGVHSTFVKVKKGEKVMIDGGTVIEAGLTSEEARQRLDDRIDDMLYSKPVSLVKKITRRIKK